MATVPVRHGLNQRGSLAAAGAVQRGSRGQIALVRVVAVDDLCRES